MCMKKQQYRETFLSRISRSAKPLKFPMKVYRSGNFFNSTSATTQNSLGMFVWGFVFLQDVYSGRVLITGTPSFFLCVSLCTCVYVYFVCLCICVFVCMTCIVEPYWKPGRWLPGPPPGIRHFRQPATFIHATRHVHQYQPVRHHHQNHQHCRYHYDYRDTSVLKLTFHSWKL